MITVAHLWLREYLPFLSAAIKILRVVHHCYTASNVENVFKQLLSAIFLAQFTEINAA